MVANLGCNKRSDGTAGKNELQKWHIFTMFGVSSVLLIYQLFGVRRVNDKMQLAYN